MQALSFSTKKSLYAAVLMVGMLMPCTAVPNIGDIMRLVNLLFAYKDNLERRLNKPATKEEWVKRVNVKTVHLLQQMKPTMDDDADYPKWRAAITDLSNTIEDEWKKNDWDHNPLQTDLKIAGAVVGVAAVGGIIWYAVTHAQNSAPANHAGAAHDGNLPPPPSYDASR